MSNEGGENEPPLPVFSRYSSATAETCTPEVQWMCVRCKVIFVRRGDAMLTKEPIWSGRGLQAHQRRLVTIGWLHSFASLSCS